jgi:hypothetical protein
MGFGAGRSIYGKRKLKNILKIACTSLSSQRYFTVQPICQTHDNSDIKDENHLAYLEDSKSGEYRQLLLINTPMSKSL